MEKFFFLAQITNPLETERFERFVKTMIEFVQKVGLALAPIMIIAGGYLIVTSAGNPEKAGSGKKLIFYSLIFLLFILLLESIKDTIYSWFK